MRPKKQFPVSDSDQELIGASLGSVLDNGDGTWSWSIEGSDTVQTQTVVVTARDSAGLESTASFIWTVLEPDGGDAPEPYPVTLADDGARHSPMGPRLGSLVAGGTAANSADAGGDPNDDGVSFGPLVIGDLDATLSVDVQGGEAKLDAWIDFNADGSWDGPGEKIFHNVPVQAGVQEIPLAIPAQAIPGTTYARFRLSTAGGLATTGIALDGEVEDYAVSLAAPASSLAAGAR